MKIIQDQINEKSITLIIKGGKISAKILAKAIQLLFEKHKNDKIKRSTPKIKHGKQRVKDIVRQGVGVTNVEITDANIKSFKPIARKYGVDYALKKDTTEDPPKWIVFFKSRDADALMSAFKEFTAKNVKRNKKAEKPSLLENLKKMKEVSAELATDKVKNKDRGIER